MQTAQRYYKHWRKFFSWGTRWLVSVGGIGVLAAVTLIFLFLLSVVLPLWQAPRLEAWGYYPVPGGTVTDQTLYYLLEEHREIGLRVTQSGRGIFFRGSDGQPLQQRDLLPESATVSAFAAGELAQGYFALGLADGRALLVHAGFRTQHRQEEGRTIHPELSFPLGPEPIPVDPEGRALIRLALQADQEQLSLLALTEDQRLLLLGFTREESFAAQEPQWQRRELNLPPPQGEVLQMLIDLRQQSAYVIERAGQISLYDIHAAEPRLVQQVRAGSGELQLTRASLLSGGLSLLIGDQQGGLSQWMPLRDQNNNRTLALVRRFESHSGAISALATEYYRKGFAAVSTEGHACLYYATTGAALACRTLVRNVQHVAFAPRADLLLIEEPATGVRLLELHNPHPEFSWQAAWGKVWYEGRAKPDHIWQSSSANDDFEPKFSLMPLGLGTLKAAFYTMLFSVPIAILGAMYTAYFMSAGLRALVKPVIEIMEALPTVILGFLAGLWFAPLVEKNLPGFLLIVLTIPAVGIGASALWFWAPPGLRRRIGEGREFLLLIPLIIIAVAGALWLGTMLERLFFGGNTPLWLFQHGIDYAQRNAMVVGIAMGFAVIPTIFSISEDAIFSVPRHLSVGSLALGASRWQTMIRIVLLTASPGIFSAVMIGLGRAVGETMIVIMATGNTPIMDLNLFQGFRAMSANIAVEMPESEVGSTHYRMLFLCGLLLFLVTFLLNTVAEIVRQRLRQRYSNL